MKNASLKCAILFLDAKGKVSAINSPKFSIVVIDVAGSLNVAKNGKTLSEPRISYGSVQRGVRQHKSLSYLSLHRRIKQRLTKIPYSFRIV